MVLLVFLEEHKKKKNMEQKKRQKIEQIEGKCRRDWKSAVKTCLDLDLNQTINSR